MRNALATKVVEYLEKNIFHCFGVPEYVHSNSVKQFVSNALNSVLKKCEVRHIKTALYAPQANASERVNRSIIAKFRIFLKGEQSKWDEKLSEISSVLRSDWHESIKTQPFKGVLGYSMIQHAATSYYNLLRRLESVGELEALALPPATAIEHRNIRNA